jgi:hypothetical protein
VRIPTEAAEEPPEAEAEAVPEPRATKPVMKVCSTSKERRNSTTLAKMNTSRAREESNGTRTTEEMAPAEAEDSTRAATGRATGATLRTS